MAGLFCEITEEFVGYCVYFLSFGRVSRRLQSGSSGRAFRSNFFAMVKMADWKQKGFPFLPIAIGTLTRGGITGKTEGLLCVLN
jgi:hypothetical protein